jgi:hypothetical protein
MNQTKVYKDSGGDRLVVADGGNILLKSGSTTTTEDGIGAKAGGATVAASEQILHPHKTTLTLTSLSITMTDTGTNGCHGSQKVYDFPAGNIAILGAVTDLSVTAGAGGITNTASLVGSVGTAAVGTDNATLTSTEANIVPSTAGTLTDGAGNVDGESTAIVIVDGTGTAADAYLNFAVPDAGASANDTLTVSGTITITWLNLGDN